MAAMVHYVTKAGVVADSEDFIKSSADALGSHRFINYFSLQESLQLLLLAVVRGFFQRLNTISSEIREDFAGDRWSMLDNEEKLLLLLLVVVGGFRKSLRKISPKIKEDIAGD
ncbi:hypothetical protein LguiA_007170 [Lonicera macranthoides]